MNATDRKTVTAALRLHYADSIRAVLPTGFKVSVLAENGDDGLPSGKFTLHLDGGDTNGEAFAALAVVVKALRGLTEAKLSRITVNGGKRTWRANRAELYGGDIRCGLRWTDVLV